MGDDILDFFDERAAIIEFDGCLTRREAERKAKDAVIVEFGISTNELRELIRRRNVKARVSNHGNS